MFTEDKSIVNKESKYDNHDEQKNDARKEHSRTFNFDDRVWVIYQCVENPGKAKTEKDVEYVAAQGMGYCHVAIA